MAQDYLAALPPFPSDVPTAPLLRLSLSLLLARDPAELKRFYAACEDLGFFYLDLSPPSTTESTNGNTDETDINIHNHSRLGPSLQSDADRLFSVGEDLFRLPVETKQQFDFSKSHNSYFGYKAMGANVDRSGNVDRNEFYNVSKDDLLDQSTRWPAPDVLNDQRELLGSFVRSAHEVALLVLELLNDFLKLPKGTLQGLHRLAGISGDQVRFIKAPPQPKDDRRTALGEHTDFGSVTVLFNRLGGLQVLPPGDDAQWCYVKPLRDHAIVNLGDAMVKFTNGRLRSNIHRVNCPPGEQADCTRYSLVYFNRPEDDVVLKRLESSVIPPLGGGVVEEEVKSKDWIIRRALGKRPGVVGKLAYNNDAARGTEELSRRASGVVVASKA